MAEAPTSTKVVILDERSPILIRIHKQEHEIEVYRADDEGTYYLHKTYQICKFSGTLGPKFREGDRQAPEGFYSIKPSSMRHQHRMDIGYPNQFDKDNHRTGSAIQIHGHCSSIGCFALTDEPATSIYNNVRSAFRAGQKTIQVQIYPFKMTDENMSLYKDDVNYNFWLTLKQGYDKFEKYHRELNVIVDNKQYIIN